MSDYFSKQSIHYARSRPEYPRELFEYLLSVTNGRELAWDAGTGNGQCAKTLALHFQKVHATDVSKRQIEEAVQHDHIDFRIERAEACSLPERSADLITVATALHWFDIPSFYKEAERILKPGGVLAAWSYAGCRSTPAIDAVHDKLAFEVLHDYWPKETWLNWKDQYQSVKLPYPYLETPLFEGTARLTLERFIDYLYSWSGVHEYIKNTGKDAVTDFLPGLIDAWGDPDNEQVMRWPLYLHCSRKPEGGEAKT